ncbi:hypothetical protein GCM10014715_88690 [Streptomyces spiralis]|uniref:Uncharacterized protein n=1 Tax=Streptomyces spiralis TaxID=66376 RepID=A0A919AR68_9ACTN|nr:hypothetical protein [Streptomyces spiralis]GHF20538.1 hypothetical protein GCM10014715_88690 [Streptomyces spiralis]
MLLIGGVLLVSCWAGPLALVRGRALTAVPCIVVVDEADRMPEAVFCTMAFQADSARYGRRRQSREGAFAPSPERITGMASIRKRLAPPVQLPHCSACLTAGTTAAAIPTADRYRRPWTWRRQTDARSGQP